MDCLIDKITEKFFLNISSKFKQKYFIFLFTNECNAPHIKDNQINEWSKKHKIKISCKINSKGKFVEDTNYELIIFNTNKNPKDAIFPIIDLYQGFNLNNIDYNEKMSVKLIYFNVDDCIRDLRKCLYYKNFLVSDSIFNKFSKEEIYRIEKLSSSELIDYIIFFYDTSVREEVKEAFSKKLSDPLFIIRESSYMLSIREFPYLISSLDGILNHYKEKIRLDTAFGFFNGINE